MNTETITSVLTSSLTSALWMGLATFIFKTWFENSIKHHNERELEAYREKLKRESDNAIEQLKYAYNEKLETHKAQLTAQSQIQIESMKTQLQITASQNSVRYSRVFEKTAEVIATTYEKIVNLKKLVKAYIMVQGATSDPTRKEERKHIQQALSDIFQYYEPREIYVDKDITKQINSLTLLLLIGADSTDRYATLKSPSENQKTLEARLVGVDALLTALQDAFRKVLGLSTVETPDTPFIPTTTQS